MVPERHRASVTQQFLTEIITSRKDAVITEWLRTAGTCLLTILEARILKSRYWAVLTSVRGSGSRHPWPIAAAPSLYL